MQPLRLPQFTPKEDDQAYAFGPFVLRADERRLLRNGITVPASPKVIETLILLVEQSGEVVTKSELIDKIWPGVFVEEGNLTQNISQLRKIFRDDFPAPGIILTVPKRGYSFTASVQRVDWSGSLHQQAQATEGVGGDLALVAPKEANAFTSAAPAVEAPEVAPASLARESRSVRFRSLSIVVAVALLACLLLFLHVRNGRGVYASRPSLAILGFQNLSGSPNTAWLSSAITENLDSDLSATESLRLVPGEVVLRAERELALPPTASLSKASLERVHRDLDCDLVVVGSYLASGGSVRLNISVEDTATGKIIGTYNRSESEDKLLSLIADSGVKLRKMLRVPDLSQQSSDEITASQELNPEVLKLYHEGLQRLRLGEAQPAQELLQRSIELSPKAPLAHLALSEAWSLEGYDLKAGEEARESVELSKQLSRENQLRIQARFFATQPNWSRAAESYRALHLFFPDDREYSVQLASALISAGKPAEALQELNALCSTTSNSTRCEPRELLLRASALTAQGLWPEALAAAQQGAAQAKSRGALILYENALAEEATALGMLGETESEDATILQALSVANQVNDRFGSMTLLLHRAGALRRARNYAAALEVAQQALDISKSMGARQRTVEALTVLGSICRDNNDLPRAESLFQRAFALAQEIGSPRQAVVELNLANVVNNLGQPEKARLLYLEALKSAETVGDRGTQNILHGNLGILEEAEGNPEAALKMLRLALAGNEAISQKVSIAYDLGHVANVLLMEGDFAGARHALDEQAAILPALGHGRGPEEQRYLRGEIAIEEGRTEEALVFLDAALASCHDPGFCSSANRLLARLWLRRGDAPKALPFAVKSYELTSGLKNPADYILPATVQLADVDAALGRTEQAQELYGKAARQSEQLHLLPLELMARSGKAALRLKVSPSQARLELSEIEREAVAHKLLLIAHRTAELLSKPA